MINHTGVAILLLISSLLSALSLADDADAVNERIPVHKTEMEAHWQVECTAAWEHLLAAAAQYTNRGNCGIPNQLRREIQLCAFIYQAPGGDPGHDCPDYSGLLKQLNEAEESGKCPESIPQQVDCQPQSQ
ncbi:MAG: hypothetical protein DRQ97_11105 [Gammaproteobacteria bacterium]|nr:MAG: hypothetical protein DRQ97_11105 [Gammaproteobacteria bacterium]